jgi:excisionase family DNA binding protein
MLPEHLLPERTPARPWRTQAEAAAHFQVTIKTIRRWVAEGILPAYRVGRQIRIKTADLDALPEQIPAAN